MQRLVGQPGEAKGGRSDHGVHGFEPLAIRSPFPRAGWNSGAAGRTAPLPVEKPGEGSVLRRPHLPPGDHAPVPGAGEGDVEEPQVLGELLAPGESTGRFVRLEVEHLSVSLRFPLVVRGVLVPVQGRIPRVPGEGQEDEGKLEALGSVHGKDPHELLVALEPELEIFIVGSRLRPPPAEPDREPRRRRPLLGLRGLEEVRQVPDVGEPPRPVRVAEEARGAALGLHEPPQERADPPCLPVGAPAPKTFRPLAPRFFVLPEVEQPPRVQPEEIARERTAFARPPAGLGESPEQALHLFRFPGLEHARVAHLDAPDVALAKGVRDEAALRPGADKHRHVRAGEGTALEDRPAVPREREQPRDLVRRRARREGRRPLLRPAPSIRSRGKEPEAEGTFAGRSLDPKRLALLPAGRHPRVRNRGHDERIGPGEDRVHRLDECGHRPPVAFQLVGGVRRVACPEVGEDVRPPEPVDGLLGIADDEEPAHPGRTIIRPRAGSRSTCARR